MFVNKKCRLWYDYVDPKRTDFQEDFSMAKLVETIPNFSCSKEKDEAAYNALVKTANSVPVVITRPL